jgi:CRISPR/Cas system-associated protein Cas5 (RAMP superfamily)
MTLQERLREYFQRVVKESLEKSSDGIVEFAERSKAVRTETAQAIEKDLMEFIGEDEKLATKPEEVLFTDRIGYVKIEDVHKLNNGKCNALKSELRLKLKEYFK